MPIYEFICGGCGPFEQRRTFAEAGAPMSCPSCEREARRIFLMPNTRSTPAALSGAMNRAEKSAYEPAVVRQPAGSTLPGAKYSPGHGGHCHH